MSDFQSPKILIVDDHRLLLGGTRLLIKEYFPDAVVSTAKTATEALEILSELRPDLAIVDLSLPLKEGDTAQVETGLNLLQTLFKTYPDLNITVQSSNLKSLVRLKHLIDGHQAGFTVADKGLSEREIIDRINWSLRGVTHTKDLKMGLEIKPEWLEVLKLASEQGLQDKAIARKINVSERMVRHYWTKLQDALEIYPEDSKNLRVLTLNRAREEGLLD